MAGARILHHGGWQTKGGPEWRGREGGTRWRRGKEGTSKGRGAGRREGVVRHNIHVGPLNPREALAGDMPEACGGWACGGAGLGPELGVAGDSEAEEFKSGAMSLSCESAPRVVSSAWCCRLLLRSVCQRRIRLSISCGTRGGEAARWRAVARRGREGLQPALRPVAAPETHASGALYHPSTTP